MNLHALEDAANDLHRIADALDAIAAHLNGAPASGMQEDLADSYRRGYEAGSAAPATSGEGVTT